MTAAAKKLIFVTGDFCSLWLNHGQYWGPACLWDESRVGTGLIMVSQRSLYDWKSVPAGRSGLVGLFVAWSEWVLAAEAKKAGSAGEVTCDTTARPPCLIVSQAWSHYVSIQLQSVTKLSGIMQQFVNRSQFSEGWLSEKLHPQWAERQDSCIEPIKLSLFTALERLVQHCCLGFGPGILFNIL